MVFFCTSLLVTFFSLFTGETSGFLDCLTSQLRKKLNHFGYCFVTVILPLALICCGSYHVVIYLLQRHMTFCFLSIPHCGFFGNYDEPISRGGTGLKAKLFRWRCFQRCVVRCHACRILDEFRRSKESVI